MSVSRDIWITRFFSYYPIGMNISSCIGIGRLCKLVFTENGESRLGAYGFPYHRKEGGGEGALING
jgi:hypothetical protein